MNYDSRRWMFLLVGIMINICVGFGYAWSVFQKPLIDLQNWPAADVSLAFTLIMGTSALPQAFAGKAQEYTEPKQVILVGGIMLGCGVLALGYIQTLGHLYMGSIIVGLGIGVVYSGTVSNLVRFFPDRRGLAAGLLAAGMGSGAILIAPLASFIILKYGVLMALKTLGLLFLVITCGLSRLVETAPLNYLPAGHIATAGNLPINCDTNKTWREMLMDVRFYALAGVFVIGGTSGMMIMGHASPIAQEVLKISPQAAAAIVGFLAIANAAGRVFWGWLSDKTGRYPILVIMYLVGGGAMLALSQVSSSLSFTSVMMSVALCYGGFMGMMASLTADTFGPKYLGVNFGIMFLTVGVAAFIGPHLAAVVRETNHGDYSQAFVIAAALNLLGIAFALFAYRKQIGLPRFAS